MIVITVDTRADYDRLPTAVIAAADKIFIGTECVKNRQNEPAQVAPTFRELGMELVHAIEADNVPRTLRVRNALHALCVLNAQRDIHGGRLSNSEPRNAVAQLVRELDSHPCRQYFMEAINRCRAAFRLPTHGGLNR